MRLQVLETGYGLRARALFAIVQAGLFPLIHMGRAWFFYWLVPYPSTMGVWPQFRSSLTWDVGVRE